MLILETSAKGSVFSLIFALTRIFLLKLRTFLCAGHILLVSSQRENYELQNVIRLVKRQQDVENIKLDVRYVLYTRLEC